MAAGELQPPPRRYDPGKAPLGSRSVRRAGERTIVEVRAPPKSNIRHSRFATSDIAAIAAGRAAAAVMGLVRSREMLDDWRLEQQIDEIRVELRAAPARDFHRR